MYNSLNGAEILATVDYIHYVIQMVLILSRFLGLGFKNTFAVPDLGAVIP